MFSSRVRAAAVAAATLAASMATLAAPAVAAGPVCAPPIPKELCGGRIFAEPLQSLHGLTYREMIAGFEALEAEHPEWVSFEEIGSSADGLSLYSLEVTAPFDETGEAGSAIPLEDRKIVLVNQSIHGNEPGGREGGTRYAEDLVTGVDPERTALLDRVRLVQTFINPDGWSSGDHDHVQTGGGAYVWARQNGDGPVAGAGDLGLGIDLNRQAPWFGPSRRDPGPNEAPEMQAYVEFVRDLAATGDIQSSVDIHGEVTDAAALIMLSAGEYDLDEAMKARVEGDAMVETLFSELSESQVYEWTQMTGSYPAGELIASSEFAGGGTDTGYVGDWVSMADGGDSSSLSTIELYNFIGAPGVNSLTARPEVMQLYRDTVAGILGSMIESAALEHDTSLQGTGTVGWVDAHARVTDPVNDEVRSSAKFYEDLTPQLTDGMVRLERSFTASDLEGLSAVIVSHPVVDTAALQAFAQAGGTVVLTDAGVDLADELFGDGALAPGNDLENDAIIDIADGREGLLAGVRDDAFMIIEPLTVGFNRSLARESDNLPVWGVDATAWTALGGTVAATSAPGVVAGTAPLGEGQVTLLGQLTPDVPTDTVSPIDFGLESYGVLDTGYIMLANALGGEIVTTTTSSVPGAPPVGDMTIAELAAAPAPSTPASPASLPALLVLVLGAAIALRTLRAEQA